MRLCRLHIEQFRNLQPLTLEPHPALTVISGQNGQGKTNLLESIWMLSGAKSFRAAREAEVVQRGQSWARLEGVVESAAPEARQDTLEVTIRLEESGGRRAARTARKNGVDFGRAGNLAGEFPCVVFAPGHIEMVSGAPEGRRRFLDAALCQLYPGYLENLRRYTRALLQKNACLKAAKNAFRSPAPELLEPFDAQLALHGAAVAARRREYTAALAEAAAEQYRGISDGRESLQLSYLPCTPQEWEAEALLQALRCARPADARAGFCTVGVHRDDVGFRLDDADARTYASQGQRRSIVLSAKIAELELIGKITSQTPVLLLDDVLSELDDARQDYLLNRIQGKQVFITSCNPGLFAHTGGQIITLENGCLLE